MGAMEVGRGRERWCRRWWWWWWWCIWAGCRGRGLLHPSTCLAPGGQRPRVCGGRVGTQRLLLLPSPTAAPQIAAHGPCPPPMLPPPAAAPCHCSSSCTQGHWCASWTSWWTEWQVRGWMACSTLRTAWHSCLARQARLRLRLQWCRCLCAAAVWPVAAVAGVPKGTCGWCSGAEGAVQRQRSQRFNAATPVPAAATTVAAAAAPVPACCCRC